jgi:hypothetical protein
MNWFVRLDIESPANVLWLAKDGSWVHDIGGAYAFKRKKDAESVAYYWMYKYTVANRIQRPLVTVTFVKL